MQNFLLKATKFFLAVILIPLFPATLRGIWRAAQGVQSAPLFFENPLGLSFLGVILWVIFSMYFRLPPRIYVFAHEMTHALFIKLCGGKIKEICIKSDSGYVMADRTNFLITLSPYLFPFYAMCIGLVGGVISCFYSSGGWSMAIWIMVGVGFGYHWTLTLRMLGTDQSDFSSQGWFFSFVLILLVNLLWMFFMLMILPKPSIFWKSLSLWAKESWECYLHIFRWGKSLLNS